jgi:hypothetical protein
MLDCPDCAAKVGSIAFSESLDVTSWRMAMKALSFIGADLVAAVSVLALCWAVFATCRLIFGLGI